jgi:glucose-fructose oxidoreductase
MKSPHNTPAVSRREFIERLSLAAAGAALASNGLRAQAAQTPPAGLAPRKLGVAIVGLGNYARGQIAPALKLTQHCQLMGVVTGDPTMKGKQWSVQHGFPEKNIWSYETMHQIADNKDIDIVYVITPNALHAEGVIAAAKAGKHVISEKPFTTTVADAEKALAACKAAKVKISIGYRMHFDPFTREFKRLAREKDFGPFMKMSGVNGFRMGGNRKPWRAEHKLAGGGPLMDMGLYALQAACMAQEEKVPVAVTAKEHPKTRPEFFLDVEEGLDWTMEFANGAKAELGTSYNQNYDRFRAEGDKGWAELAPAFSYRNIKLTTSNGPSTITAAPSQQAIQLDDFAMCVREGRESSVSGEMGLRDMKVLEAIYASAANGGARTLVKA